MAGRRDAKPSPANASAVPSAPPYFVAVQPLYIGGQFGRAHNPGDRVSPEHVERYGWADLVRPPDGYDAAPAPAPVQSPSAPETGTGQATTTGKGDA